MSQLSLFSADLTPPRREDLGGLLAAHGQIARSAGGARLSIVLADHWRAKALLREFRVRDIPAEMVQAEPDRILLRSERIVRLNEVADRWTRGAAKSVPDDLIAEAGLLRCWTLAAGRPDESGFLLGLDGRAPDTHQKLAAVLARAGLAGVLLGARGGGPGLRIVGRRRWARLIELLGTPPPEAPIGAFPLSFR